MSSLNFFIYQTREDNPMGCTWTACSTMILSMGCRGTSAEVPGALPGLLLQWLWYLKGCFSLFFLIYCFTALFVFLNLLSQRCNKYHSLTQLWPAVGPFLEGTGTTSYLTCSSLWTPHRHHPYRPFLQTLATSTTLWWKLNSTRPSLSLHILQKYV